MTEQEAWESLVYQANELGSRGIRVIGVAVIPPRTAADDYTKVIHTDNGPRYATEAW